MVNPGDIEDHPTTTIPPSWKSKARARPPHTPHPSGRPHSGASWNAVLGRHSPSFWLLS
jgi:hypothetical protein